MGQMSMFDGTQPFKITKPVRLIELFAGIGSQAKALKRLGVDFEHWFVCDFDRFSIQSYNAIHGTNFQPTDITRITASDLKIIDTDKYCYILTYSYPCQDLSIMNGHPKGMVKGSGTRSALLWEVERLIKECKILPQVLVMENVPMVIGKHNIHQFAEWLAVLDKLKYTSKWKILNAKDYGVPQSRQRFFMVSVQGDYYYDFG